MRAVTLVTLALGIATLCGSCRRAATPAAAANPKVVAVVAGTEISGEALAREWGLRTKSGGTTAPTLERKLEVLESLVREEAVFAKAKAARFEESPEMQAAIRRLMVSRFKEQGFSPDGKAVTAADVETFYKANVEKYATPAAVRGAILLLAVPATATAEKKAEARVRAEPVLAEARKAPDAVAFAAVVARHSADQATRYRGGELPWLTRESKEPDAAVTAALFAVPQQGEFAPLVETPRGIYIAKLLEKRQAGTKPLAQVEDAIRYELGKRKAEQAERDFYASVKSGLDITIHRDVVESLTLPAAMETAPPGMPGNTSQNSSK